MTWMTKMISNERAHSRTGASSCKRWVNCPASVQLHRKVGDSPATFYTAEGTVAHEIAELALRNKGDERKLRAMVGQLRSVDGFSIPITDEMVDGALLYAGIIFDDMDMDGVGFERLFVEQELNLGNIVSPNCFGTVDAVYVTANFKKVSVYDYKFGKGVAVEAKENEQMSYYALAALAQMGAPRISWDNIQEYSNTSEFGMTIIQPRCQTGSPVKRWDAGFGYMVEFAEKLRNALDATEDDFPEYCPGDDQCRWCPGKLVCPALKEAMHKTVQADFHDLIPVEKANKVLDVTRLSSVQLSAILQNEKLINNFLASAKEEVRRRLEANEPVEGYALGTKKGNRVWRNSVDAQLYPVLGDTIYEERKLKSPAQVEKLGKQAKLLVAELTERPDVVSIVTTETKRQKILEQFDDLLDDI